MEVQKFPPSPNWYLSDIICSGPNATVIYGSRNTLVVAKFGDKLFENTSFPCFETIDPAHKERVTTVRFCPNKSSRYSQYFTSGGDDSVVKLWNLSTLSPVMANFAHGDGKKITTMDWTWGSSSHVLSIDDTGLIVAWDLEKNITTKINVAKLLQAKKSVMLKANAGKLIPLVVKCCPHQDDLVAVGMKGGQICLLTLRESGRVLHCLRGHDKDITSMTWCPVPENVLGGKDDVDQDKAFLLASVCRDRTIFLWRCIDGLYQKTIKLPTTFLGRHSRLPASGTYVTLDWPTKETIICSSNYGEIIKFDLSSIGRGLTDVDALKTDNPVQAKRLWCLVHDIHPRCVFAVHCDQYTKKAGEGGEEMKTIVWTTAQDRHLVAVSLDDGRVLVNIPTIGGFVYCLAASPFDPSRIAAGIGDFSIRLWNTGNSKEVQMSTLWQKIKGKVMALAWHPTQEMKLAFGTHEGRVGLQDISPGRLPVTFNPRHQHAVYALTWGPPCYKEGENEKLPEFCLYSCGDGEILRYNPDAPDKDPKRMIFLMRGAEGDSNKKVNSCTDVAWKPDYSLLAVGNNDGTVQLFTPPHLKLVYTLYAHRKLLMTLAWHPLATSSDTSLSSLRHCLATGSNENVIHVYDLSSLCKAVAEGVAYSNPIQAIAKLTGHQKKVVRLSWSPHTSGYLCSASYDNTVRVWDVVHHTCVACFTGHSGAGLACMWSSLDPDIIISGSTDFTLCSWRISSAKYVPKSTGGNAKKRLPPTVPLPVESDEKLEKNGNESNSCVIMAKSSKVGESNKASFTWRGSLFPISWKIAGGVGVMDGVSQLLRKEEGLMTSDDPVDAKLLFFGDREEMHCLLKKEEDYHVSQDNVEQAQLMALWRGNVAEMIKDAISKGTLSDWLVSMAPTASHKLWVEACQAYSEQLAAKGKYNHAATYLLACHKVDDAIKLLRGRSLYREALAIARCRLAVDDPTARDITLEWGRNLFTKGNYEVAAMCFTAVGEYLEAARALSNRTTISECISMAVTLALKAGDEGKHLAHVLTMQCMHTNLQCNNWDAALDCLKQVKDLKSLSLVVELHRKLIEGFRDNEKGGDADLLCRWLTGESEEASSVVPSSSSLLQPPSPLPWSNDKELSAEDAYSCISNHRGDKVTDPIKNLFLEIAEELALSVCAASSAGELNVKKWNHILKAMALCYSQQLTGTASGDKWKHSLLKLCCLLAPNGPEDIDELFDKFAVSSSPEGFTKSAKAYFVFAAVAWVEDKWVVDGEKKWPWSEMAAFLLGHLKNTIDPPTGEYFKAEVELHKVEQELIKAKTTLKLVGENCLSGVQDKSVLDGESGGDLKEYSLKENGVDGDCGDVGRTEEGFEVLTITESKGKALEEIIKGKEAEIGVLRERRELFERSRISAPNPFICFFKLRSVCDMMVKSCVGEDSSLPSDIEKLKEVVTSGIAF